jgi:hypothetical protein
MKNFFRAQKSGISFKDMQNHVSHDGGEGWEELGIEISGICACDSVTELKGNTVMGAMNDNDEVVVFTGNVITEIYDGYRVEPVQEITRFTVRHFLDNIDEIAEQYERW